MNDLFSELKRRNVVRVGAAYAVVGWLIIEVVDTLAPRMAMPDWVPGFAIILVLIGFPIALLFAWAYEITPDGLKKTADVEVRASVTVNTGRKIDRMIIGGLVVVVGFLLADRFLGLGGAGTSDTRGEVQDASIAVLPFVNLSSDPEQEYFSDGISEELLNVLAQIPDLRVAARTSSFQFKGENRDIIEIANQLHVGYVLDGSVRKSGLQVRITAQLIDATTGFHLWSETFDRNVEDVFAVQDEISAAIVAALKERLGLVSEVAPRVATTANTEAHEAYLRGRHLVVQRTRGTIDGAVLEFEKALALDPDYALAHAELSLAFHFLYRGQYGDLTISETLARAAPHATRALELAPNLAEAQAAAAFMEWRRGALEPALEGFARAIAINPNYASAHNWIALIRGSELGRYTEAMSAQETALRLDPLSIPAIGNQARSLLARSRVVEAEQALEKLASIAPAFRANIYAEAVSNRGEWSEAALGELEALRIDSSFVRARFFLSIDLALLGLGDEAVAASSPTPPFIFSWLGETDGALHAAEAIVAEDPESLPAKRDLALALAGTGDFARARPFLEDMWRRSGGRVTEEGLFRPLHAVALIAARRASAGEAATAELLEALEENVRRWHEAGITTPRVGYNEGLFAYLSGDRRRGLALIATAVDEGLSLWPAEAYLKPLYDDPGFAPILAADETHQTEQRNTFLAIVCTDNPYAAVWLPEESSCAEWRPGR